MATERIFMSFGVTFVIEHEQRRSLSMKLRWNFVLHARSERIVTERVKNSRDGRTENISMCVRQISCWSYGTYRYRYLVNVFSFPKFQHNIQAPDIWWRCKDTFPFVRRITLRRGAYYPGGWLCGTCSKEDGHCSTWPQEKKEDRNCLITKP